MFGPDLLVAPVLEESVLHRHVYLPAGHDWTEAYTGRIFNGGQTVQAEAPLDIIPVFLRDKTKLEIFDNWYEN